MQVFDLETLALLRIHGVDDPVDVAAGADGVYWLDRARGRVYTDHPGLASPRLVVPPRLDHGMREGCGDTMMGAIAAQLALGRSLEEAIVMGAGAGAANFMHAGLGTGKRSTVEELAGHVRIESFPDG